jgi:hypothetical protein
MIHLVKDLAVAIFWEIASDEALIALSELKKFLIMCSAYSAPSSWFQQASEQSIVAHRFANLAFDRRQGTLPTHHGEHTYTQALRNGAPTGNSTYQGERDHSLLKRLSGNNRYNDIETVIKHVHTLRQHVITIELGAVSIFFLNLSSLSQYYISCV